MQDTKIEWTDHTFNPWEGCTKVSPGCLHCYAETRNARWNGGDAPNWGKGAPRRRTSESNWKQPLKWNREAPTRRHQINLNGDGVETIIPPRPRVFCASLADWLDDEVPIEWLADLLDLVRITPQLDWLLLTKRPQNWYDRIMGILSTDLRMAKTIGFPEWLYEWKSGNPPENVWIGTTVEDQTRADERIPMLLNIPAKVRFLSCEPLLGPLDLMWPESIFPDGPTRCCGGHECGCHGQPAEPPMIYGINWIIAGGESGPGARPMDPDWARSLRDQCQAANVAFFMKQMGGTRKPFAPIPDNLLIRQFPTP